MNITSKSVYVGTVVSNPSHESSTSLQLEFPDYDVKDRPILYPNMEVMYGVAADEATKASEYGTFGKYSMVSQMHKAESFHVSLLKMVSLIASN